MLLRLANDFITNKNVKVNIIVINSQKDLENEFRKIGAHLFYIRENFFHIKNWFKIITTCLSSDVIVGWMYHGNVLAFALSRITFKPFIQNIRQSLSTYKDHKFRSIAIMKLDGLISFFSKKIIFNSELSMKQHHEILKYNKLHSLVIPNGFQISNTELSAEKIIEYRNKLGLKSNDLIILHVARYHSDKDQATLIKSAVDFLNNSHDAHFILVGTGLTNDNNELTSLIPAHHRDKFHFLGERYDLDRIFPCADIFTLCSRAEAFPNVLAEAMSYGVYPISTAVGDAAVILSDYGQIVPVNDTKSLSQSWVNYLNTDKVHIKKKSEQMKKSIRERYDISQIATRYFNSFIGRE